jgi:hypothetical protein
MTASMKSSATSMRKLEVDVSTLALGLAALTTAAGLIAGFAGGVSAALLAFVTGGLLGAILLVWHSLRTLAGDAPIDPTFELAIGSASGTEIRERKQRALRALKDIEQEHAVGKMDDADYAALDAEYRAQAKAVIRELDASLEPFREKAEALVRTHQARQAKRAKRSSSECASCGTGNDADATFCKKCGEKLS